MLSSCMQRVSKNVKRFWISENKQIFGYLRIFCLHFRDYFRSQDVHGAVHRQGKSRSYLCHQANDLVQDTEEGRGKLRNALARCMQPLNQRCPNVTSRPQRCVAFREEEEPGGLKRLSTRRKRNQIRDAVSISETKRQKANRMLCRNA